MSKPANPDSNPETVSEGVSEAQDRPFSRRARLTVPLISMAHREVAYVEILDKMVEAPMASLARNERGTVPVVRVKDLENGEDGLLICSELIKGVLGKFGDNYIGKRLEIANGPPIPGKRYRALEVYELE